MIELEEEQFKNRLDLLVLGVGNAGCMVADSLHGWREEVRLLNVDTDAAALKNLRSPARVQAGADVARGFGTAENPMTAKRAFSDDRERIKGMLGNPDIVFIIAGLGGGVGSGAAPMAAEAASESGALSVSIATMPFLFEGKKRIENAGTGLKELYEKSDALVVIPNEDLFSQVDPETFLAEAFRQAGSLMLEVVRNICEIMMNPGAFNVDLPRIRQILGKSGMARFGSGEAEGADRWSKALDSALKSPLLKGFKPGSAGSAVIHIRGGRDITQDEIRRINSRLFQKAGDIHGATGVTVDRKAGKKLKIWLLLTGIKGDPLRIAGAVPEQSAAESPLPYDLERKFAGARDELEVPAILRRKKRGTDGS